MGDVLVALLKDGRIFAVRREGETEPSYVAAECLREVASDPRVETMWVAPSLMRQHSDLFEVFAA